MKVDTCVFSLSLFMLSTRWKTSEVLYFFIITNEGTTYLFSFSNKILLDFKTIVNIELTWENYPPMAKSSSLRLLIRSAKQFNLIMTSFNSIVFN